MNERYLWQIHAFLSPLPGLIGAPHESGGSQTTLTPGYLLIAAPRRARFKSYIGSRHRPSRAVI